MTGSTGIPERIGHYTVASKLGSGGMGEVFLAYSPAGEPVAVKLVPRDKLDPHTRARFEREARVARQVIGTGRVARFFEADPSADRPWLAMEYVAGRTLSSCVDEDGVLPSPLVASLGMLLAEGLGAVHAAELLHRDLKPQNVMMDRDGPVIIDFGLAAFMDAKGSLTHSGTIIGSVRCMPPEQANGVTTLSYAADVYALGTVLLYAATGHYPYDGAGWEAVVAQVSNRDASPNLSGVPDGLRPLIGSMLAHDPEDRPTLDTVTTGCGALLQSAGVAPAHARLALIARTTEGGLRGRTAEMVPPAVAKLLEEYERGETDEPVSPLDAPPGGGTPDDPETDNEDEDSAGGPGAGEPPAPEQRKGDGAGGDSPAEGPSPHPAPPPPRPGTPHKRPPARKVAKELRDQYAARSAL